MKYLSLLTLFSFLQKTANSLIKSTLTIALPIKLANASGLSFEVTQDSDSLFFNLAQKLGSPLKQIHGACSPRKSTEAVDPLYDTSEAAEYIGVKENTLTVWRCVGRYDIEYIKVGRLVKYRQSALDAFLQRRTRGGGTGMRLQVDE